jgi:DNA-binding CsgD family transcriptional regulator/tetratricopeptide (TPR) repeat protein
VPVLLSRWKRIGGVPVETTLEMPESPLIGRSAELDALDQLADAAARGRGGLAVLCGVPGIGKTRLVKEALARCGRDGFATFMGAAHEMEQRRPFGVIAEALRLRGAQEGKRAEIRRLLRGEESHAADADGGVLEFRVCELVLEYAEDLAASQPVALVLDDLHWADPSSLVTAHRLARECGQLRLLLICALRPYPERPELRALLNSLREMGALRVDVGPLSDKASSQLATELAGAPPGRALADRLATTGGNPLFVREFIRGLMADGTMEITSGLAEVAVDALPPSLRLIILHRFGALAEETLRVLRTAAALGSSFAVADLAVTTRRPVAELAAALGPALTSGALIEAGDQLTFRHDLIREVLYEDMPLAVRKPLHRELAATLAEAGASSERIAEHLVLGADIGDSTAIGWLRRAAHDAAPRSLAIAIELLERALGLCPNFDPVRLDIEAELAVQLIAAARGTDAEALCRRAIGAAPGPAAAALFRVSLARALFNQGRLEEALAAFAEARLSSALTEPTRMQLSAYAAYAGALLREPSAVAQAQAVIAAHPPEPSPTVARAAIAVAELFDGRPDRALDQLAGGSEAPSPIFSAQLLWCGIALTDLDRLDEARRVLQMGLRGCLDQRATGVASLYHLNLVCAEFCAGRFDAALAEHEAGMELAEDTGHRWRAGSLGLAALIAVHRGELGEARQLIATAEAAIAADGPQIGDSAPAWAECLLAEARGDDRTAAAAAKRAWDRRIRIGDHRTLACHGPDTVRVALASGDRELAERAASMSEKAAAQLATASRLGGALRCRGLLEGDPQLLVEAVAAFRGGQSPLELALALQDAAEALARTGDQVQGRPLAAEALRLYEGMGADADLARAQSRLRSAGLRVGVRGPRGRPQHGWGSLTEAELRVVRLIAEGRSNPEIASDVYLTRRTVRAHVSSALRKLDLSSRVELALEAARRGL